MADKFRRDDLARFYEEVGEKYNEEEVVYRDLRGILRKNFILDFIKESKGNFLDLGCNTGTYTELFKGELAVGVDLSQTVLTKALARLKKTKKSKKYLFIKGNIETLNFFNKNKFDFILCSEVLEHLFHPKEVFNGIAEVLKPGGKVLITTPNYKKKKPTWIQLGELGSNISGDEYFHTAFRPQELAAMAQEKKMHVLDSGTLEWQVKYAAKMPALLFVLFRFINKNLIKSKKIDRFNQRMFEQSTLLCYTFSHYTGLEKMFKPFIREGVRSFVILTK